VAAARRRLGQRTLISPGRSGFLSTARSSEEWILHAAIHHAGISETIFPASALPLKYGIREFHHFLLSTNLEHKSYFPNTFLLSVGESTFRGRLSMVCYEQMLKFGLVPPKIEIVRDYKIYSDRGLAGIVELNS